MVVLATCHRANADFEASRKLTENVLDQIKNKPEALINLAFIELHSGNKEIALEKFLLAFEQKPFLEDIWDLIISLSISSNKLETLLPYMVKMFRINSKKHNLLNTTSAILNKINSRALAEKTLLQLLDIEPQNASVLNALGALYLNFREFGSAIDFLQKATEANENMAIAWNNLGMAFHECMKLENAEKAYWRALNIKPKYAEVEFRLATVYYLRKEFEKAIKHYTKSFENGLTHDKLLLSLSLQKIGKFKEAIKVLRINC